MLLGRPVAYLKVALSNVKFRCLCTQRREKISYAKNPVSGVIREGDDNEAHGMGTGGC